MSKYETLVFDLDDTLIDNNLSIKYAFTVILDKLGIKFTDKLFSNWKEFDKWYWNEWESGNMIIPSDITTIEDKVSYLRTNRFIKFFKSLNLDLKTAIEINDVYTNMLGANVVEIDGASKLLSGLSSKYEIVIGTNGPKNAAIEKVKKANLTDYVSFVVSSEEVGYSKPMPEFFDCLVKKCENSNRDKMLLIGDSLTTDVLGGMNNGIDTCWFNSSNIPLSLMYKPTLVIYNLEQLELLL